RPLREPLPPARVPAAAGDQLDARVAGEGGQVRAVQATDLLSQRIARNLVGTANKPQPDDTGSVRRPRLRHPRPSTSQQSLPRPRRQASARRYTPAGGKQLESAWCTADRKGVEYERSWVHEPEARERDRQDGL